MTGADAAGWVACISATGAAVTSIIVAVRQKEQKATMEHVANQVDTPGDQTLGETVAHVHDVVCNHLVDEEAKP